MQVNCARKELDDWPRLEKEFAPVVERAALRVAGQMPGRCVPMDHIEDLEQVGWIGVVEAVRSFDPGRQGEWGIVKYVRCQVYRRMRNYASGIVLSARSCPMAQFLEIEDSGSVFERLFACGAFDAAVACRSLPEKMQNIIILRSHGHTRKEIAELMGMPRRTLERAEQAAIKRLREILDGGMHT